MTSATNSGLESAACANEAFERICCCLCVVAFLRDSDLLTSDLRLATADFRPKTEPGEEPEVMGKVHSSNHHLLARRVEGRESEVYSFSFRLSSSLRNCGLAWPLVSFMT